MPVWAAKLWHPKNTLQVFFFQLYLYKIYVEVVISDFTIHLIILKWLKRHKCRQKGKKTMRQKEVKANIYIYKTIHSDVCYFKEKVICTEIVRLNERRRQIQRDNKH